MVNSRAAIFISVSAVGVMSLLTWISFRKSAPEPMYDDRSLSDWLVQLADGHTQAARDRAAVAVKSIGTNAIPPLLQMLREKESPHWSEYLAWRQGLYNPFAWHFFSSGPADNFRRARLGFDAVGGSAAPAVPELLRILDEHPSGECQHQTLLILADIGPDAKAAVPALLQMAVSPTNHDHDVVFDALGNIHAEPQLVVPVFTQVISNVPQDRYYAVSAIRKFGTNAESAVPELVALYNDPSLPPGKPGFISDRENIARALQGIDIEIYAKVVTNEETMSMP